MVNIRTEMAALVQRNLNSVWESKVVPLLTEENTDLNQLNTLAVATVGVEKAFQDIIEKYKLKILVKNYLTITKFKGLPRRFKVVLEDDSNKNMKSDSILNICKKKYIDEPEKYSFMLVYNAYVDKLILGKTKNYYSVNTGQMLLQITNIYVDKENNTIAAMQDVNTNQYYKFNMDTDLLKLEV